MLFESGIGAGVRSSNSGGKKRSRQAVRRRLGYCLEALESRLLLSTANWTNAGSGSWNTPGNWSTNAVPQPGDDVIINQPGNIQVTLTGSTTVHSISVTGDTLSVSAGTLSVAANSSINAAGTLVLSSATLTLVSGATLTNSGSITVNPLSRLNVGAAYTQTSSGSLTLPSGTLI